MALPLDSNDLVPDVHYYAHRICTPSWNIDAGIIDFLDLTYVLKGHAIYTISNRQYSARAGDIICINKNTSRHAISTPENLMECHALNFQLRTITGEDTCLPLPVVTNIGWQPDLLLWFHDIECHWRVQDFGYLMKIRAHTLLILQRILELILERSQQPKLDVRIHRAVQFMHAHYDQTITIEQVAEMVHLNPVYFGALFKRALSATFKQYLTSIRLNHAEHLLRNGEHTVSQAALLCGFSDVFYFSKIFKENRGVTPSDVRYITQA